jgi:hypothetical protein
VLSCKSFKGRRSIRLPGTSPTRIVEVGERRAIVETETRHRNGVSIERLQKLADRVFAGEIVEVPLRERSAFNLAVLTRLPGVAYALNPRRVWLEGVAAIDAEFDELEIRLDQPPRAVRSTGRIVFASEVNCPGFCGDQGLQERRGGSTSVHKSSGLQAPARAWTRVRRSGIGPSGIVA